MGKWPWQCTTRGLDNSTKLRMEKIRQAVTDIWVLQVWQPPARPPGPWRQYPSSPDGWGVKWVSDWDRSLSGGNTPPDAIVKKIHSVRIGSHAIGGTVLYQCLDSSGLYPRRRFGSFTKMLEDGRMMRKVCIASRWKQPFFCFCFFKFPLRLYSNYYSFVYFHHYHYFINLSKYVKKLIWMLPVIWLSMSETCHGIKFFTELISFTKIFWGKKYTCRSIDWKRQI